MIKKSHLFISSKAGKDPLSRTGQLPALFLCLGSLFAAAPAPTPAQDAIHPYEVRIIRDTYGVPHIIGKTSADVAYALGKVQCEDRVADVVYNLHAGSGRLAEVTGEKYLNNDKEARLLRNARQAKRDWSKLSPQLRRLVEAYAQGVNDWLAAHPNAVPVKVKPFTPIDVIAWHRKVMMLSTVTIATADGNREVGKPHPGIPPGQSNSWVVSGMKSTTGRPLLLIDPHWPTEGHLQLYEARLKGGRLDAWGFMLVGTPLVGLGATPAAAWTFTAGGADSSDAYALRINPDNPNQYEWDGEYVPMEVRQETLRYRDGKEIKEVVETFRYTRHGPVGTNKQGEPYAARHGNWNHALTMEQFWRMNTARNTVEFKAALAMDRLCYFNVTWATTEGHIGYVQTGEVPRRSTAYDWEKRVPGWTSNSFLEGNIPFAQLPQVEDPSTHFLQNCNVAANVVTPGLGFTKADFPPGALYGHYGAYRARGQRVTSLLSGAAKLDLGSAGKIVFDTYVPPADIWIPIIVQSVNETSGITQEVIKATQILEKWDRYADVNSVGATIFRFWRMACDDLKDTRAGRDAFHVDNNRKLREKSLIALNRAVADLKNRYGRIDVPWGQIKRHQRGNQEWPLSGDGLGRLGLDTLRATSGVKFSSENTLINRGGQSTVALVFLGKEPKIHAVVAFGQSNVPDSPHYSDQAPLFVNGQLRSVQWNTE